MNQQQIAYVTSNPGKYEEALFIFEKAAQKKPFSFQLTRIDLDLEEIQASAEKIIQHKTQKAFSQLGYKNIALIVDDISFYIKALNGFPGPYIKYLLHSLGAEGIWTLVSHYQDRQAHAICSIGFMRDNTEGPLLFTGKIEGEVVCPKSSKNMEKSTTPSWNEIFQPEGKTKTVAEMSFEELYGLSPRSQALHKLYEFLLNTYTL